MADPPGEVRLSELAAGWRTGNEEPEATLAEIGFLAAVQDANVLSEAAA